MDSSRAKRRKKGWSILPTDMERWLPNRDVPSSDKAPVATPSGSASGDGGASSGAPFAVSNFGGNRMGVLDPQGPQESRGHTYPESRNPIRDELEQLEEDENVYGAEDDGNTREPVPNSPHGEDTSGVVDLLRNDCGEQQGGSSSEITSQGITDAYGHAAKTQIKTWSLLLGLLHATGSRRLTRESYDTLRRFCGAQNVYPGGIPAWNSGLGKDSTLPVPDVSVDDLSENDIMKASPFPHERTVRRMIPDLCQSLTARPTTLSVNLNIAKSGARRAPGENQSSPSSSEKTRVDVVLPSEWARLDLLTSPVWQEMTGEDVVPLITRRQRFYGNSVFARRLEGSRKGAALNNLKRAVVGDVIALSTREATTEATLPGEKFCQGVLESFDVEKVANMLDLKRGRRKSQNADSSTLGWDNTMPPTYTVVGCVVATWTVGGAASWKAVNEVLLDKDEAGMEHTTEDVDSPSVEPGDGILVQYLQKSYFTSSKGIDTSERRVRAAHRPDIRLPGSKRSASGSQPHRGTPTRHVARAPVLPGDTVTLLRSLSHGQESGRLLFLNRFWCIEGEARQQLLWVPDLSSVRENVLSAAKTKPEDCPFLSIFKTPTSAVRVENTLVSSAAENESMSAPIRVVLWVPRKRQADRGVGNVGPCPDKMSHDHGSAHGNSNTEHVPRSASASGKLKTGEKYFTYRLALYHDGFVYAQGRPASAEALYMVCLSLPRRRRHCRSAVRIISLAPPGTDIAEIYDAVLDDVLKGASEGFQAMTADGTSVRVFLDLVAIVADTPAGNALLDVLGHTSNAPCHLCRFRREVRPASLARYTATGVSSRFTSAARHWKVHEAIRRCEPRDDELQALGMTNASRMRRLPLHRYAERLETYARLGELPVDVHGRSVVPGCFDPYHAVVVAPDHLLCGIFRDSVNAAIALFPSPDQRRLFNSILLSALEDAGLPGVENELVNASQASLHSMTMSSTYAIAVVAAHALRVTVAAISRDASGTRCQSVPEKLRECITVVASAADLIYLFHVPECESRPKAFGDSFVQEFDVRARKHLGNIEDICKSDVDSGSGVTSRGRGRGRARSHAPRRSLGDDCVWGNASPTGMARSGLAETARKHLDKPNVHRLLELAHMYLPSFGHGSFLSELMFESAHQSVKRSLERANKFWLPHITALRHILLNDFKARLAALEGAARKNEDNALRGCVRLLFGREALQLCGDGTVPAEMRSMVARALGPSLLVSPHLQNEGSRVMSRDTSQNRCRMRWIVSEPGKTLQPREAAAVVDCDAIPVRGADPQSMHSACVGQGWSEKVRGILNYDREVVGGTLGSQSRWGARSDSAHPLRLLSCEGPGTSAAEWKIESGLSNNSERARGTLAFLGRVEVGSIISCNCWDSTIGRSSTSHLEIHRPFVRTRDNSDGPSRPCITLWCVTGLLATGTDVPGAGSTRPSSLPDFPSSSFVHSLIVRPCQYVESGNFVSLARNSWRAHRHRARNVPMKVHLSLESHPFVIHLEPGKRVVDPVAVLHDCEFHECPAFREDGSLRPRVSHTSGSSPLDGGQFYVRERLTGFPPRQA